MPRADIWKEEGKKSKTLTISRLGRPKSLKICVGESAVLQTDFGEGIRRDQLPGLLKWGKL